MADGILKKKWYAATVRAVVESDNCSRDRSLGVSPVGPYVWRWSGLDTAHLPPALRYQGQVSGRNVDVIDNA
jgi:hypothetical protein